MGVWVCDSLRYYIVRYQQEKLVGQLSETLKKVQTGGFEVLAIEPRLCHKTPWRVINPKVYPGLITGL